MSASAAEGYDLIETFSEIQMLSVPRRGGVGRFKAWDGQAGWRRIARPTTPNTSSANSSCGSEFALFGHQQ
jgi:hypothetical protein